jgi:predicted N-acetyltransferase YhbS
MKAVDSFHPEEAAMDLLIRRETEDDHRQVEELTREAFWNL